MDEEFDDWQVDQAEDCAEDNPMLFGRVLDGKGAGRPVTWEEARNWKPEREGEVLWTHMCRNRPGVGEWLEELGIPDLIDRIADETVGVTEEEILPFLQEKKHPALDMDPIIG